MEIKGNTYFDPQVYIIYSNEDVVTLSTGDDGEISDITWPEEVQG